ncbi:MAG: hypothetical protein R6T78_04360 [Dehalococcoidales bacterium]
MDLVVSPAGDGSISINGIAPNTYPARRTFNDRLSLTLEAQPAPGYYFVRWSGDLTGTQNPLTVEIDSSSVITANFARIVHSISMGVHGGGTTEPPVGVHEYNEGETVDIRAIPDEGWQFDGWSGGVYSPELATTSLIVGSDKAITASFSPVVHTISMEVEGGGSTKPAAGNHQYDEGETVNIQAFPESGWYFDGWSGGVSRPELALTTLLVSTDKTVTASFSPIVHTVSMDVEGSGSTEPAVGSYDHNHGDMVDIRAIPDEGWRFDEWSGDVSDPKSAVTTLTVSAGKKVTASFSPIVHTVSIDVEGSGSTEPAVGSYDHNHGDMVDIRAIPDEGWRFDEWSGDVADSASSVTTTVASSDKIVTARFARVESGWWQTLHNIYDGVMEVFRSMAGLFSSATDRSVISSPSAMRY